MPAMEGLTDEESVVRFAFVLENAAAQTYTLAGGLLNTPVLRQAILSIGGVEARHAAVLNGVLGEPQVPDVFLPTDQAAPPESFVGAA